MQTVSRKQNDNNHRTQAFGPGRRRPKGLHAEIDFRGNPIWTYREGHGPRIRINETFGTASFEEAYYKARLTYGHADAPVAARLREIRAAHAAALPVPEYVGRSIRIPEA